MSASHGIHFKGSKFWVFHRRREYGPFDYEWSKDFCGVELMFQNTKFGEYCSGEELFADLSQFKLPKRVVEVSSIVLGCIIISLQQGMTEAERADLIAQRLKDMGYEKYLGKPGDCSSAA